MHALTRWIVMLLATALIVGVPRIGSGEPNPDTPAAKRAKVKGRLKQIRAELLRKRVGLDEATATRVEAIFDKYRSERAKQQERLRTNRKAIADLIKADSGDQAAYSHAIAEVRSAEQELGRLRNAQTDELSKALTPKQQAKLAIGLRQLQRKLRAALRRQGEGGATHGKNDKGARGASNDSDFGF